jgi:hypothetical protein
VVVLVSVFNPDETFTSVDVPDVDEIAVVPSKVEGAVVSDESGPLASVKDGGN